MLGTGQLCMGVANGNCWWLAMGHGVHAWIGRVWGRAVRAWGRGSRMGPMAHCPQGVSVIWGGRGAVSRPPPETKVVYFDCMEGPIWLDFELGPRVVQL